MVTTLASICYVGAGQGLALQKRLMHIGKFVATLSSTLLRMRLSFSARAAMRCAVSCRTESNYRLPHAAVDTDMPQAVALCCGPGG